MNPAYLGLVYFVWFLSTYFIVVLILSLIEYKEELFISPALDKNDILPNVSIIISAFNEEESISASLDSLLQLDYPKEKVEIIVVNDGSTDNTREAVQPYT